MSATEELLTELLASGWTISWALAVLRKLGLV